MHYKNGREAKNGDHVVTKHYTGNIVGGVIYDLEPNGGQCNCKLTVQIPGGVHSYIYQDVGQMFHAEDAYAAMPAASTPDPAETMPDRAENPPLKLGEALKEQPADRLESASQQVAQTGQAHSPHNGPETQAVTHN